MGYGGISAIPYSFFIHGQYCKYRCIVYISYEHIIRKGKKSMVTEKQFKAHYENLYNKGAIYVWGANCQIITKDLMDKLYASYGSKTYTKAYYTKKLNEGKGKIAADCSGSALPLSGVDRTAKGYYNDCVRRGSISAIPKDKACFVFNANFTHIGAYLGNGYTIEMRSSALNVYKEKLNKSRWAYYGIPSFVSYPDTVTSVSGSSVKDPIVAYIQKWVNTTFNLSISVDGEFGPQTKSALCIGLQTILKTDFGKKIEVDGVFGPKTKAAIPSFTSIKKNANMVRILHAILYCRGYDSDLCSSKSIDTSYSSRTTELVKKYQSSKRGLRIDGKAGVATFYSLFS